MNNARYQNGFNVTVHHDLLDQPLKRKKPERYFVCGMTDMFHDDIPDSMIQKLFETMNLASHHPFSFCTKRSERLQKLGSEGKLQWAPNIWAGVTVENMKRRYRI